MRSLPAARVVDRRPPKERAPRPPRRSPKSTPAPARIPARARAAARPATTAARARTPARARAVAPPTAPRSKVSSSTANQFLRGWSLVLAPSFYLLGSDSRAGGALVFKRKCVEMSLDAADWESALRLRGEFCKFVVGVFWVVADGLAI